VSCGAQAATGCFGSSQGKARLQLKRSQDSRPARLRWLWRRGDAMTMADLFDPMTVGADYAVCLYDARKTDGPVYQARIAGGTSCGSRPCWRALGSDAVKYSDREGRADGVAILKIAGGAAGTSKLQLIARGMDLALPGQGPLAVPLTIQVLAGDGSGTSCWQSTYTSAVRNTDTKFSATAP